MNVDEFINTYKNLKSTCTRPPRRVFVRLEESEQLKKEERIKEIVGKDEKSGKYTIEGVPLEIIDYMVDPVYMFW